MQRKGNAFAGMTSDGSASPLRASANGDVSGAITADGLVLPLPTSRPPVRLAKLPLT